jgi:hypothetical protein
MLRRKFLRLLGLGGVGVATVPLAGCGVDPAAATRPSTGASAPGAHRAGGARDGVRTVVVNDLVMEGWSTLGSGYLGPTGTLRATQIRDFLALDLAYIQDPHGHRFALSTDDLAKLLLGERVSVFTTYAQSHRHEVRINPAHQASGSQPIEVEIDETGRPTAQAK